MRWLRKFSVPLVLVLVVGASCTAGDSVAPSDASSEVESRDGGVMIGYPLKTTELLACEAQPYVVATQAIGPEGGSLSIGRHRLDIPRGALASRVRITGEQISGSVNSVRLSPEGLRFSRPARLTLSYRNCAGVRLRKRVVYTNELLKILESPLSEDYPKYEYVTGAIDHFSRYAVAY